jgi:hypothetical protein
VVRIFFFHLEILSRVEMELQSYKQITKHGIMTLKILPEFALCRRVYMGNVYLGIEAKIGNLPIQQYTWVLRARPTKRMNVQVPLG